MNEIVNKFLLTGDKFIPQMHLRQPGYTYTAWGPFTKNKETIRKYIYHNKLDKACSQHSIADRNLKKLTRRTVSDKILTD